jgi:hypothetical protein
MPVDDPAPDLEPEPAGGAVPAGEPAPAGEPVPAGGAEPVGEPEPEPEPAVESELPLPARPAAMDHPPAPPVAAPSDPSTPGARVRQPDPQAPFVAVMLAAGMNVGGEAGERFTAAVPPTVSGVVCPDGHFTDPAQARCVECGASMAGQTPLGRTGPRPPLGMLVLDEGSVFRVDMDFVIGREPHQDPDVAAGTVRPLRIIDDEGVVSRRHARVALAGWGAHVADLGSANGTFVQHPGDDQARQLRPNQPAAMRSGTQVTIGRRWFRFESHRVL